MTQFTGIHDRILLASFDDLRADNPRTNILAASPLATGDWMSTVTPCHDILLRDRVIEGHKVNGTWFVPRVVKNSSGHGAKIFNDDGTWQWKYPERYRMAIDANGASIGPNLRIRYLPGEVLITRSKSWWRASDEAGGYDNPETMIDDLIVAHFYGPLRIKSPDAKLGRIVARDAREVCLSIESPFQGGQLHGYCAGEIAVQFTEGGETTGDTSVYGETAPIGVLCDVTDLHLDYLHSINCSETNVLVRKPVHVKDSNIVVDKVGWRLLESCRDSNIAGHMRVKAGATGVELAASFVRLDLSGGGGKTFLKTTAPVSNCRITGLVSGGETAFDFSGGLGWNNVVDVQMKGVARPFVLPRRVDPRNRFIVNGVQEFPKVAA
jgi:hypothetical protein